jgi:hypothetical protein
MEEHAKEYVRLNLFQLGTREVIERQAFIDLVSVGQVVGILQHITKPNNMPDNNNTPESTKNTKQAFQCSKKFRR